MYNVSLFQIVTMNSLYNKYILIKKKKKVEGWGYNSVVECLPRISKALGSSPSTGKKKKA
jgi:hypothetical protein